MFSTHNVSLQDGKLNRLTDLSLPPIKSTGAWNHTSAGQMVEGSGQDVNVPPVSVAVDNHVTAAQDFVVKTRRVL